MTLVLYWPKISGLMCASWSLCSVLRFLVILLLCLIEGWLLSPDPSLSPFPQPCFWQFQLLAHSHILHTIYILTLDDINICIHCAFTNRMPLSLFYFPQLSNYTPLLSPSFPKSHWRPCQDCYLKTATIPSHSNHHLSSFQLILSTPMARSSKLWTLQGTSSQLIIQLFHCFNIFSYFASSLRYSKVNVYRHLYTSNSLTISFFILLAGKNTTLVKSNSSLFHICISV